MLNNMEEAETMAEKAIDKVIEEVNSLFTRRKVILDIKKRKTGDKEGELKRVEAMLQKSKRTHQVEDMFRKVLTY